MNLTTFFAFDPNDTDNIRLEKLSIFLVAFSCSLAGIVWTTMYYFIFGWEFITLLPFVFSIVVGSSLVISHITKNHHYAIYTQIICIMFITTLIQWRIGGVFDSGFVLVWSFLGPVCALMFFSIKRSIPWFLVYLVSLTITLVFNDFFVTNGQVIRPDIQLFLFLMNMGVASTVVFTFTSYYVNVAIKEHEKTNNLLQTNLEQELALRQNEKLATLGKLSAGVAHELNNPVAAAQRGAVHLRKAIGELEQASMQTVRLQLSLAQLVIIETQTRLIQQRAKQPLDIDPLTRSDLEYDIEEWLDTKGVENAWELAPMLVSIGYTREDLVKVAGNFNSEEFPVVSRLLSHTYTTYNVLEEIGHGSKRIAEIVKALKSYSYLDQAPTQSVDIHDGLNDTLVMLGSKLKLGVEVQRDYALDVPHIEAFGSELNQVWTNIIDNAIGAMDGQGEIVIKTSRTNTCVVVEITDSGPGMPPEVQSKIFDPFYTTKAPGEGTGLGLNISHNIIVQKHKGAITVDSKPGETRFEVKLPINYENPQLDN
jgi:signal transduction histidine kinase